jgi:hypothetical protein
MGAAEDWAAAQEGNSLAPAAKAARAADCRRNVRLLVVFIFGYRNFPVAFLLPHSIKKIDFSRTSTASMAPSTGADSGFAAAAPPGAVTQSHY